jgi:alpha-tubulin suppressor-like RCC1 family protein
MSHKIVWSLLLNMVLILSCKTNVAVKSSCGDDYLDPGEECDGALMIAATCLDLGYYESTGAPSCNADCTMDVSMCSGRCGDGTIQTIHGEKCEGQNLGGETCTSQGLGGGMLACGGDCRFDITGCEIQPVCGDSVVTSPFEQCEQGDLNGTTCQDLGYYDGALACGLDCRFDVGSCVTFGRCGDGTIQKTFGEQCEGADVDEQDCPARGYYGGELRCGTDCHFDESLCIAVGRCGDETIQTAFEEVCDGVNLDGQSCLGLGYHGGALACSQDCRALDESDCVAVGRCGDETIQAAFEEVCDGVNLDGQSCLGLGYHGGALAGNRDWRALDESDCVAVGRCGDELVQTLFSEECDGSNLDGASCASLHYHGGTLSCDGACRFILTDCEAAGWCGDSVIQGAQEQCEAGQLSGMTCRALGHFSGNLACSADCQFSGCQDAVLIDSGFWTVLTLLHDGTVKGWGRNTNGQLGNGTSSDRTTPSAVSGLTDVTRVSSTRDHGCAVKSDGTLRCWGSNSSGQLGDGTTNYSLVPVSVSGIGNAVSVSAGWWHSCAILDDGTGRCWGQNDYGRLGDDSTVSSLVPVIVEGLTNAVSVITATNHSCALLGNGSVRCWGRNHVGQLGNGSNNDSLLPVNVSGLSNATALSGVEAHTCALTSTMEVWCWGANSAGQLGDGTTTNRSAPVKVSTLSSVEDVAAGYSHTCAVLSGGAVRCWGTNANGQLGNGSTTISHTPVAVSGLTSVSRIAAGISHSCAVKTDGMVWCWGGDTYGELGNGSGGASLVPVQVSP